MQDPSTSTSSPSPSSSSRKRGRAQAAAAAAAVSAEPAAEVGASEPVPREEQREAGKEARPVAQREAVKEGAREAHDDASPAARFDGLPEEVRGVLQLFGAQLAQLSFPEVDAVVLARHGDEVLAQRRAVEAARLALEEAAAELARRTEELSSLARRGLAYAKIYAAAHPERAELAAELSRLDGRERPVKVAPKREDGSPAPRRGRPPKTPRPELPFAVERGGAAAVAAVADDERAAPGESIAALEANADVDSGDDVLRGDVDEDAEEPVLERDEPGDASDDE